MRKQLSFLPKQKLIHGGSVTKGHARFARPLCSKRPIHLVMRSTMATGVKSFLRPAYSSAIEKIVQKGAQKCGVKIYDFANGGNHLHFIVKITNHGMFKRFLRTITALIARLVLGAEKSKRKLSKNRFWDARPFTRIAAWGKAYDYLKSYLTLNKLEALGFVTYQPRIHKGRKLYSIKIDPIIV